jgi:hypothetical protein
VSDTFIDHIAAIVRRAEAEAYERGKADAKRELLEFLGHKGAPTDVFPQTQENSITQGEPQQRSVEERQRAPKGVARKLAMRVLYSTIGGMTPAEILKHASSDHEKMVKPASMRSELRNGKQETLYIDENGKWMLTETARIRFEAEAQTVQARASASSDNNNGGKSEAAALAFDLDG